MSATTCAILKWEGTDEGVGFFFHRENLLTITNALLITCAYRRTIEEVRRMLPMEVCIHMCMYRTCANVPVLSEYMNIACVQVEAFYRLGDDEAAQAVLDGFDITTSAATARITECLLDIVVHRLLPFVRNLQLAAGDLGDDVKSETLCGELSASCSSGNTRRSCRGDGVGDGVHNNFVEGRHSSSDKEMSGSDARAVLDCLPIEFLNKVASETSRDVEIVPMKDIQSMLSRVWSVLGRVDHTYSTALRERAGEVASVVNLFADLRDQVSVLREPSSG